MMDKQIWARVQLLVNKGILTLINGKKAQAKGLEDEVLNNIELITPAGFAHAPTKGSQAVMVFPNGDRSYGIAVIVGDNRYTLELAEGGVGLHDQSGSFVRLNNDGTIELSSNSLVINAESTAISGVVGIAGELTAPNLHGQTPFYIPPGETYTVAENAQVVSHGPCRIDGFLKLDGYWTNL